MFTRNEMSEWRLVFHVDRAVGFIEIAWFWGSKSSTEPRGLSQNTQILTLLRSSRIAFRLGRYRGNIRNPSGYSGTGRKIPIQHLILTLRILYSRPSPHHMATPAHESAPRTPVSRKKHVGLDYLVQYTSYVGRPREILIPSPSSNACIAGIQIWLG